MSNETGYIKTLIIAPEGDTELGKPFVHHIAKDMELEELQGWVGGYIEAVYGYSTREARASHADVTFYVNEEGKIKNLPANEIATALWWTLNPDAAGVDHLCGVVVVTGGADGNGDTLSVPDRVVAVVERGSGA